MKYIQWMVVFLALAGSGAASHAAELQKGHPNPYAAPEFGGIEAWLNSPPLTMAALKGKVVLVDVWTYSCINCIRTLPYLTEWDKKYRDKGLVIVGVHSPEFAFEKSKENVEKALVKYGITYPVALDNQMVTWGNFNNKYWPAKYLIDQQGRIVYKHFGEGDYDVTEYNIRALLGLPNDAASIKAEAPLASKEQTHETYLGYSRAKNFGVEKEQPRDQLADYALPENLELHHWGLDGKWTALPTMVTSGEKGASLTMYFNAAKVYLVMGTQGGKPVKATLKLNMQDIGPMAGRDAPGGVVTVNQHALYTLVSQPEAKPGLLEITADGPGLEAYAFTFGN